MKTLLPLLVLTLAGLAQAQSPAPDSFNPGASGGQVAAVVVQADGKVILGGGFGTLGGQNHACIGRLYPDGTLDNAYTAQANAMVYSLAVQPDGKVLVGGDFTSLAGSSSRSYLARLNTNGTLDTTFSTTLFTPPPLATLTGRAQAIVVQPDGKLLVGGRRTITPLGAGPATYGLFARLNENGSSDSSFSTSGGPNGPVATVALQPDGKILLGGLFTALGSQTRNRIGRLNADGTVDTAFNPGPNGSVFALVVQPDGKILVGGSFTTLASLACTNLGRLNADGSLDQTFVAPVSGAGSPVVYSLALQADGKIAVGGLFTSLAGSPRSNLGRLNPDGTLDSPFTSTANYYVYGLALQADGKIVAVGDYTSLGGQARSRVARLNNTDAATQSLSDDGSTITWLRSGAGPEVWRTTFEVTTDLANWSFLGAGTRVAGGWQLTGQTLPPGGRIRARGYASGGSFNASGWFVETISGPCYFLAQPLGRTNNAGSPVSFSAAAAGSPPLSYQWLKDGMPLQDGGAVSGAQTASLSLSNVLGADAGGYVVVASNSFGSVTSLVATLKVNDPFIKLHPVGASTVVGSPVSFTVQALGTTPLSYQWRKDGVNLTDGGNISGAQTSVLNLASVTGADAGYYSVWVTNQFRGVTSFSALLTVIDPSIQQQPVSQTVPAGQTATFTVSVLGTEPLSYQWRKNGLNLPGATGPTLTVQNIQCPDGGGYDVIVGNSFSSVTSAVAFLSVDANQATADAWNPGAGNEVYSLAVQPDGRVLAGGAAFSQLGGQPCNYLGLLNADGTLDTNFHPNLSDYIYSILVQTDGKIVVGGAYTLARLNSNGTLDASFNPGFSSVYYQPRILCLAPQPDGKILVGGTFDKLGGQTRYYLGRLNADGTLDTTFNPGASWTVCALLVQPDGKILVGGASDLKRLYSSGALDTSFQATFSGGSVTTLALQADGKLLVGGTFTNLCGYARQHIGRLNADGTLDPSFNASASDLVAALALQSDGRVLASGYFTNLCGQPCEYLGRLNSDGTLDCTFKPGVRDVTLPVLYSLVIQPDGDVLAGGYFYALAGQPRRCLGRLHNTEPATERFSFNGATVTWWRGGTGPEIGRASFAVCTNGTDWTTLGEGQRCPGGWRWSGSVLPPGAKVRARGFVQFSGNYAGGGGASSWFLERIVQVPTPPVIVTDDGAFGLHSNVFGFNVRAPAGQVVVIEASADLLNWSPLSTNTLGSTPWLFTDPAAGDLPGKYYRARTD